MGKKILILAPPGFGKSSAMGREYEPDQGINREGLIPRETYVISATTKDLPFRASRIMFPTITFAELKAGNTIGRRICTNNAYECAQIIDYLIAITPPSPIKTIIIDDINYFWQDYYMDNSLKAGWDAPKKVGHMAAAIFQALERAGHKFNIVVMGHYEAVKRGSTQTVTYILKTTGKTTNESITPEGKFDITLIGNNYIDDSTKKPVKVFITNYNGEFDGARSPAGMLPMEIPNDLGYVFRKMDAHYAKQDQLPPEFIPEEEIKPNTEG